MAGEKQDGLSVGLYESPITVRLARLIESLDQRTVGRRRVHAAEIPERVALHVARLIERALHAVNDADRNEIGGAAVDALLTALEHTVRGLDLSNDRMHDAIEVLTSVNALLPDRTARVIDAPLIPLLDTTLLTNAPGEPNVGHQIKTEIASAERIDVLMAFVRLSGINPLLDRIRAHCANGKQLRLLTTTYTGSTERVALERLIEAGASVRVSYDVSTTRLHAKAWLFHRASGFSTAYIGSSNLTHSAQHAGLEWNVRASSARNLDVIDKVAAVFESYWNSGDFIDFEPDEFDRQTSAKQSSGPIVYLSPLAVTPRPFQERLLELLAVERTNGRHRNLLVAATGTGKTVMAALDYARLRSTLPRARLLFVAHRQEILDLGTAPGHAVAWRLSDDPSGASMAGDLSLGSRHLRPRRPKALQPARGLTRCEVGRRTHGVAVPRRPPSRHR